MNATAINVASLGAARDDFETNAENWPPNVKAAHDKPSPTSAHLGLELLAVDKAGGTVEMAFNASDKLCNKWGGIQGGNVAACWMTPWLSLSASILIGGKSARLWN